MTCEIVKAALGKDQDWHLEPTEASCFSFPLLWKCTRPCYRTPLHYLLSVYQFIAASVCLLYGDVYCVKVTCSKGKESPASSLTVAWQAHIKHIEDRKMDEGLIQTILCSTFKNEKWMCSEFSPSRETIQLHVLGRWQFFVQTMKWATCLGFDLPLFLKLKTQIIPHFVVNPEF